MLHQEPRAGQDPYVKDTPSLIASDKVEGTRVYGADGKHIGSIQRIILEKRGDRVAYAVLSFGGFFGIGDDYYPLPWEKLHYDEEARWLSHRSHQRADRKCASLRQSGRR